MPMTAPSGIANFAKACVCITLHTLQTLFWLEDGGMRNPHSAARNDDEFDALSRELEVPRGFAGFGNYLVWMVATRAADLVDALYDSGVARPSRE
jgi:hypothetical protein